MTTPATPPAYVDNAVFQPGTGGVFHAAVGTEPPTLEDVTNWLTADRTQSIGEWSPLGYTSVDSLPGIGTETEGGEKMGVWENPNFRVTPITNTDTVNVTPVQWSEVPITHRFGAGTRIDRSTGRARVPATYTPVEVALMVVILDGNNPLILHYYRVSSKPNGDLELDPEQYAGLPVSYTVLGVTGQVDSMNILTYALRDADEDNIPDRAPDNALETGEGDTTA